MYAIDASPLAPSQVFLPATASSGAQASGESAPRNDIPAVDPVGELQKQSDDLARIEMQFEQLLERVDWYSKSLDETRPNDWALSRPSRLGTDQPTTCDPHETAIADVRSHLLSAQLIAEQLQTSVPRSRSAG